MTVGMAALAFAGCTSFTPIQSNLFTDENGAILSVDYGRDKNEHESKFFAPNGKEMTMRSKLKVRVTLPDGTTFIAWECMNPLASGTMYRTNNEKWMFRANGISCQAFRKAKNERGEDDYLVVFDGILCKGPGKDW